MKNNTTFWIRPENMTTPQPAFMLNETNPGSAVAAETAAAMAAGSMIFRERGKRHQYVATPAVYIMKYGYCAAWWRCNVVSVIIRIFFMYLSTFSHLHYIYQCAFRCSVDWFVKYLQGVYHNVKIVTVIDYGHVEFYFPFSPMAILVYDTLLWGVNSSKEKYIN